MDWLLELMESHQQAAIWVSCCSAAMFVGSLLLVPWLVARAPHDYFVRESHVGRGGALRLVALIARNLLGIALLLVGILMLVLPGQGMLMVLLALSLLDLPGKRALVRRVVERPTVWRALSYLRERAGQRPFERP